MTNSFPEELLDHLLPRASGWSLAAGTAAATADAELEDENHRDQDVYKCGKVVFHGSPSVSV